MTPVVGVVGLGAMGAPVAARLLDAGHDVVVFDPRAEAVAASGARGVASARAVADAAEVVFVSLPSPEVVRDVALELASGEAIQVYVDLSTTGPAVAEEVAAALGARGVACVDAPVSGGPAGARAGRLTVMVAGDGAAIERVRPLLDAFAANVFVVGAAPGQGQTVKVINNLMSACSIAITAEALVLGVRAGLDPKTLLDVIHVSSGSNNAASDKFPKQVLTREFDHGFRLALMAKDVRLALDEAHRREVPMRLGETVASLWNEADADDDDDGADCTAIVRRFEAAGGAEIAS